VIFNFLKTDFPTPCLENPYFGISEKPFEEEVQKKLLIPIEKNRY